MGGTHITDHHLNQSIPMTDTSTHRERRALIAVMVIIILILAGYRLYSCSDHEPHEHTIEQVVGTQTTDSMHNTGKLKRKHKQTRGSKKTPDTDYAPSTPLDRPVKKHQE